MLTQYTKIVCQRYFYCTMEPERGVLPAILQSFGLHYLAGSTRASLSGFFMKNNNKITYFLYARKSSESEDRQVQSIEDQVSRLKELANSLGISVKEVLTEAKSAKKPQWRPVFRSNGFNLPLAKHQRAPVVEFVCDSAYPSRYNKINKALYGAGYSYHGNNPDDIIAAVGAGAK